MMPSSRRFLMAARCLGCILLAQLAGVRGIATGLLPGQERCVGLSFDLSRLRSISGSTAEDVQPATGGSTSYKVKQVMPIPLGDTVNESGETSPCVVQRLRLQESMNGVPIYGADTMVTLDECYNEASEADSVGKTAELTQQIESLGLKGVPIQSISGKTYSSINVKGGFKAKYSPKTVTHFLEKEYQVEDVEGDIATPELFIFPTEEADYLTYFVKMRVHGDETKAIRVIVDSNNLKILSTCLLSSSPKDLESRRKLKNRLRSLEDNQARNLQFSSFCTTCAQNRAISLTTTATTQEIRSLYLTDTGKNAMTTQATVISDGSTINVPGAVSSLFWTGTYHCFDATNTGDCVLVELPTTCADALSDVAWVAVETLIFLQNNLNVLGGLDVSASSPESVLARVHYDQNMCNAFYWVNEVSFGDCDCSQWTPLVSLDVIAHELSHGVTEKSSNLEYSAQSGGLNEGYADILGTVLEYSINDSTDTPDFLIGERLEGSYGTLRFMEDPPMDGRSIGSVCDYSGQDVHYTSGVPNKAYVKSVRACEAATCGSSESACALLLGKLFSYANIYRLSTFSTYLDAASNTCSVISEFYTATSPSETSCSQSEVMSFVTTGWASVDVIIDGSCVATENCGGSTPAPAPTLPPGGTDPSVGCDASSALSVPANVVGSTIGQTTEYNSVACGFARDQRSPGDWYSIAGDGGTIVVSLCNTAMGDTMLSVWTGACSNLQCVDGSDDFCSLRSQVTFDSVSGQTYYIYLYGFGGTTFDYTLTIETSATPSPTMSPCTANPIDPSIGCSAGATLALPSSVNATTTTAQTYDGTFLGCGGAQGVNSRGLWYTVTGTGSEITARLCTFASFDTQLSVWDGTCASLSCVDGSDDACGLRSSVTWTSTFGQDYYIFVYGFGGSVGAFQLDVSETTPAPTPPPATSAPTPAVNTMQQGCEFANLISTSGSVSGNTVGESVYQTEQCNSAYQIQAAGTWFYINGIEGTITAELCASTYDTMMSVWEEDGCSSLTCVGGSDDFCGLQSTVVFTTTSTKTYSIFVHGYAGDTGDFTLTLSESALPTPAPTPGPTPTPTPGPTPAPATQPTTPTAPSAPSVPTVTTTPTPTCNNFRSAAEEIFFGFQTWLNNFFGG